MCRFLSTNRRRIHKVALSHCDGTDFIIYGREHSERCHRKSKRTGSKRRSANSGGARSESRSSSAMRASARAQKPRSSGKSPASVPEAGGRLVPGSSMAGLSGLAHGVGSVGKKNAERRSGSRYANQQRLRNESHSPLFARSHEETVTWKCKCSLHKTI